MASKSFLQRIFRYLSKYNTSNSLYLRILNFFEVHESCTELSKSIDTYTVLVPVDTRVT